MKFISTLVCAFLFLSSQAQLLSWTPEFIQEASTPIDITVDATKGNQGLKNYATTSDVYVHIGAITNLSANPSDWKHAPFAWATTNAAAHCTYLGSNKWKYTITGGLRNFFGLSAGENILQIALLFRNGAGTVVQRNIDASDMYVPVYNAALHVRIDQPFSQPKYVRIPEPITKNLGDNVAITANSNLDANLKLYLNGTQVGTTVINNTNVSANPTIIAYGDQMIVAEATLGTTTVYDTLRFFVNPPINVAPLPAGVRNGINYQPGDTSLILVLFAPHKTRAAVIGDFSNWTEMSRYQMNRTPDSNQYWIRITGLTPGVEYAYQYLVDGNLKVADYMAEKILDPNNDQYISSATYPNLKPYPAAATGIVSLFQTAKPSYTWQVNNFQRPDKRNLLIYELLVRDFVATGNFQTVKDSIAYLKRLGVNAIEVMPFNEFEGNISWGYNPTFFFAPDKAYGTENALRQFIDECHKQGIAVIMDIVFNHTTGLAPTAQLYWNSALNQPAANSPWYNEKSPHPLSFGPDFNHQAAATKTLVGRVIEHWTTKYKIDGFRWDLSKGFTQTASCITSTCDQQADYNAWAAYDAGRVAIWKGYYDSIQAKAPGAYCILEHFADNSEEIALSNYGMLSWGNLNYNFTEATMGYVSTSNFQGGIYTNRGWAQPTLVTFMESHDEERLQFKNANYGNVSGSYNIKDTTTGLKRDEMATAFWAMIPAPKMIWQFGELGYDYSINYCQNGTINNACRVDPKPIRWDYKNKPNRLALYNVYSKLLRLRNVPNFLPAFVTNDIQYNLGSGFKWLKVTSDSLKIVVIGNFDVTTQTGSVTFQNAGTWYNYLSGGTRTATGGAENITLQPGEYYVYVNRADAANLVNALPLNLLSFTGRRNADNIGLTWLTSNEVNVKRFAIERSFDGADFNTIGSVNALNRSSENSYAFVDRDAEAVKATGVVYYRLRTIDVDGKYSFSKVISISPVKPAKQISIYPNPVKGGEVYVSISEAAQTKVQVKVQDVSGRTFKMFLTNVNGNNSFPVDVKALANGVYLLKVETEKNTYVQQVVVQH